MNWHYFYGKILNANNLPIDPFSHAAKALYNDFEILHIPQFLQNLWPADAQLSEKSEKEEFINRKHDGTIT